MNEVAYNLRPVWDALLGIYDEFAKICERHHLRYYVTGGTLLGAVRHNGFIPWDDDFDVVMPRPDYEEFFDIAADELPKYLLPICAKRYPTYPQHFGKVRDVRMDVAERISKESGINLVQGLYIDVIPIDGMPKSTFPFYWWVFKRSVWRHRSENGVWRFLANILWRTSTRLDFEHWLASYPYDTSPCVEDYNANARRFKARALSAESFGNPIWHEFDSTRVPLPVEYEKFLTLIYGDWQSLPSEDKRIPLHACSLNFSKSEYCRVLKDMVGESFEYWPPS